MHPLTFTAHVITGSGRGKDLGIPTLNLDLSDVPHDLKEGIHACFVTLRPNDSATQPFDFAQGRRLPAVMHYGPRPVFKDIPSCEVHLLETALAEPPETLTVEVVAYLREIADFESPAALQSQIERDIEQSRAILGTHDQDA